MLIYYCLLDVYVNGTCADRGYCNLPLNVVGRSFISVVIAIHLSQLHYMIYCSPPLTSSGYILVGNIFFGSKGSYMSY